MFFIVRGMVWLRVRSGNWVLDRLMLVVKDCFCWKDGSRFFWSGNIFRWVGGNKKGYYFEMGILRYKGLWFKEIW